MSQQPPPPQQTPQGFVPPMPQQQQQGQPPMGVVVGMPAGGGGRGGPPPPQPPPPTILQRPPGQAPQNPQQPQTKNNKNNNRGPPTGRGGGGGRGPPTGRGGGGRGPPAGRGGGGGGGPNPNSGIPYGHVPGYLPGSSSLVEELDQRLLVVLRDGRHVLGVLRTFDQFSNMVLQDAVERKIHFNPKDKCTYYADLEMTGLYVVRGDAMVLMGKVPDTDPEDSDNMKRMEMEDLDTMIRSAKDESKTREAPPAPTGEQPAVLEWDFDKDLLA